MVKSYTSTTHLGRVLLLGTALATITAAGSPVFGEDAASETETIIVTGTRTTGMTAADSAAPIVVLPAEALSHTGVPNLVDALAQQVPSFNMQSEGGDLAEYVLSAKLDGLSPNDTLVLVNGKRRHTTGDFQVDAGAYQGSAAADLSMIPLASIDHVEVLEDGAAAQYGTDAIAGVVNVILKSNNSAGIASGTVGQYYMGQGETYDLSINKGFALGDHGFLNVTYDKKYQGFTELGGADKRVTQLDGVVQPGLPYNPTTFRRVSAPQPHQRRSPVFDVNLRIQCRLRSRPPICICTASEHTERAPRRVTRTTAFRPRSWLRPSSA